MKEQEKTKHEWEFAGEEVAEYVYVEMCERCGARRRIASMFGMILEEEPEGLTIYCEDTKRFDN